MCFYDQNVFSCGDYRWGKLQQRCNEHDHNREPCELKRVFRTFVINTKCDTCQEIDLCHQSLMIETEHIRRWHREGSEYSNNVRERIRDLEEIIELLEDERRENYFDATGIRVGIQDSPLDVTHSHFSPEAWNIISSGTSREGFFQKPSAIHIPPNLDSDNHHEDYARYMAERIPIHKPQPAVLLTTPENILLILKTSDFWNSKPNTPSETDRRSAPPRTRAGTKSKIEPSLVLYARDLSGTRPDIQNLLEGYNVLDRISHMTAEEINGAVDLTEPRLQSGPLDLGSINLDIPYHWFSLRKISYDLDIYVRPQILKLLSRVLEISNDIFNDKLTVSIMALNEERSLYEQLLGRIRTRRNFVKKLSAVIETSTAYLSPGETQGVSHDKSLKIMPPKGRQDIRIRKKRVIYPDESLIGKLDLSTMASKLNIIFFGMIIS